MKTYIEILIPILLPGKIIPNPNLKDRETECNFLLCMVWANAN